MIDESILENIKHQIDNVTNTGDDIDMYVTYSNLLKIGEYISNTLNNSYSSKLFKAQATSEEQIKAYQNDINKYKEDSIKYTSLLAKELELKNAYNKIEEQNNKLLELKALNEVIENHNTENIRKEIVELENNNGTNYQRFVQLIDKANEQLQNINGLVESNPSVATLKQNCETLKKQEVNILEMLTDDLKQLSSIVDIEEKTLNSNINEYNSCLEKLKNIRQELGLVAEVHPKNLEIWNNHFSTNKSIWGNLENTENNLQKHVNSLNSSIEKNLKEYDSILKELIQQNEKKPFFEIHK